MENKEIFNDVLDEGEVVLNVLRPNKKKYWAFFNWMYFWAMGSWLLIIAFVTPAIAIDMDAKGLEILWISLVLIALLALFYFAGYFVSRVFASLAFKKRHYAYTNKRIIIRCGIIGVDYRVLDYKLLGATTVTVGVLDRMMGGKTGYIRFGSASSPIVGTYGNGMGFGGFTFSHVDMPYDLLKEIKKIMNVAQEEKK